MKTIHLNFAARSNFMKIAPLYYVMLPSSLIQGIQEETTYLCITCFTIRETTEQPITVTMRSNHLVYVDILLKKIKSSKIDSIPPFWWDGNTAMRIKSLLYEII